MNHMCGKFCCDNVIDTALTLYLWANFVTYDHKLKFRCIIKILKGYNVIML